MKTVQISNKHPLHDKVVWIRRNWSHVTVDNERPDGYLVITVSLWETGGQGRTFLQSQINECIQYVKGLNDQVA